ncbi:RNA 2'-phosphotransferase [Planococcus sp. YIM B11945]|uniref:RNA 2'-phosphotransferase n=1 Tax=Planococcus sp. YIM B11945 TaxID=3435410 RepID=UPI003D7E657C
MQNKRDKLSVFISLILRHNPQAAGISLDEFGYASVEELIKGVNKTGRSLDFETLKTIVKEDKKNRYSFNESMTLIRANQGHSLNVKVSLRELAPPEFLYHGTAKGSLNSILSSGINKRNRLYVHLSDNKETALQVGKRHGVPVVLTVESGKMYRDGHRFYLSENNVWQVDFVPTEYLA